MRFYFLLILASFSVIANAQTAKELLDNLSNSFSQKATYYIKFDYELKNKTQNVSQKESGEIYAAKDKYNLRLMGINQIHDGKKVYTIYNDDKEVNISKSQKDGEGVITPSKILSIYKTGFNYKLDKSTTVNGKKVQYIKLTPTSASSNVNHYLVGIYTESNQLYQYQEVNKENTVTTLTVKEYIENLIIPKSFFTFDEKKYKSKGFFITEL